MPTLFLFFILRMRWFTILNLKIKFRESFRPFAPMLLAPVYVVWMKLAFLLGWVNSRILLCVIFFLIITPIALIARIFNRDALDRRLAGPLTGC